MSSIAHPAGWLKTAQRHRTTGKESSCAQLPCEGNIKNYGINKVEDKVNYTPSLRAVPIRIYIYIYHNLYIYIYHNIYSLQHTAIVHLLHDHGCEIVMPNEIPIHEDALYRCGQCDKGFMTMQALATHMYHKHGTMSVERPYIQSTTCAGCLKDFHTTWRVQQHLRYRPNGCWDRIFGARQPDEPCTISLAPHLKRHQAPSQLFAEPMDHCGPLVCNDNASPCEVGSQQSDSKGRKNMPGGFPRLNQSWLPKSVMR